MLITDYSSVMFDYAVLDRPIVIYAPDWDAYRRTRGVTFDLLAEPPGVVATTQADLVDAFITGEVYSERQPRHAPSSANGSAISTTVGRRTGWCDGSSPPRCAEPMVHEQVVPEPAVPDPAVPELAVPSPAVPELAILEPAVAEPAVAEPAVTELAILEPAVAEPAVAEPAVAELAVPEPAVAELAVAELTVAEPAVPAVLPAQRRPPVRYRPSRLGLMTYAVTQTILLAWWFALYPGLMSYDTVMYVWQATHVHWSTSHSVVYDGLLWLSLQAIGGLGLLTFVQTVVMAAGVAYVVTGLRQLRVRGRWLVAGRGRGGLPASSRNLHRIRLQGRGVRAVRGVAARHRWPDAGPPARLALWWALFAELALISLFRPNGFLVIALAVVGIALALRSRSLAWRLVLCGVGRHRGRAGRDQRALPGGRRAAGRLGARAAARRTRISRWPARPAERLSPRRPRPAVHRGPTVVLAGHRELLQRRLTVAFGRPQFSIDAARAHARELFDLWLRVLKRAPDVIIQARICRGSIAWNPFPGAATGRHDSEDPDRRRAERVQLPDATRSPRAPTPARSSWTRSAPRPATSRRSPAASHDTRAFEWIAWRGATWSYLAYLAVGLFAWRRRVVEPAGRWSPSWRPRRSRWP